MAVMEKKKLPQCYLYPRMLRNDIPLFSIVLQQAKVFHHK
jgi:hypothetical protein